MQGNMERSAAERQELLGDELSPLVIAVHELKTPLALIRQLGLGLESSSMKDSWERMQMLRQIILTSERALRLTTDLSRFSRLEDSLFDLEPLNPRQICEEVAHELTPLYKAKGREIRVSPRYKPLLAVANRELLRRVIFNFGDNALHYGGNGTLVELRAGAIDKGEVIRVGVRDYGPAVPHDMWQHLQAHMGSVQPLHSRPQSSGLGLLIARQFASAMRGQIGARRHRDGVTFYIDMNASTQLSLL